MKRINATRGGSKSGPAKDHSVHRVASGGAETVVRSVGELSRWLVRISALEKPRLLRTIIIRKRRLEAFSARMLTLPLLCNFEERLLRPQIPSVQHLSQVRIAFVHLLMAGRHGPGRNTSRRTLSGRSSAVSRCGYLTI